MLTKQVAEESKERSRLQQTHTEQQQLLSGQVAALRDELAQAEALLARSENQRVEQMAVSDLSASQLSTHLTSLSERLKSKQAEAAEAERAREALVEVHAAQMNAMREQLQDMQVRGL